MSCHSGGGNGGGGGGGAILEGRVFDCVVVEGATIEFRVVLPGTNTLGRVLGTATTGSDGRFTRDLGNYTGWVHADASGGSFVDPFQGPLTLTDELESIIYVQSGNTSNVVISASTTFAVHLKLRLGRDPATSIDTDMYNVERVFANFTGVQNVFTTEPDFNPSSGAAYDHLLLNIGIGEWAAGAGVNPSTAAWAAGADAADFRMDGHDYDEAIPLGAGFMPTMGFAQTLGQAVRNGASFLGYDVDATMVDETLLAEDDQFLVPPTDLTIKNFYDDGSGNGFALILGDLGPSAQTTVRFIPEGNPQQSFTAASVDDLVGGGLGVQPPAGLGFGRYILQGTDTATGIRWDIPGFRVADLSARAAVSSFEPADGPSAGGTLIKFYGDTLSDNTAVQIANNSAVHVASKPSEWIMCRTPPGTGLADITLTNPGTQPLTLSAAYRYDRDGVGLDYGFDDQDQILVGGKFHYEAGDYTIDCYRYKVQWTGADSGTYSGPHVHQSMMAPDPVQANESGQALRARAGPDAVIFTFGEGFHRFRVNDRFQVGYGLRNNGVSYAFAAPTGVTAANVNTEPFHIVGVLVDVRTKEHTTLLGVGQLHADGTGEVAGQSATRKSATGDVDVDTFATYISSWRVASDGLIDGMINLQSGPVPFKGQTDAQRYPRYFWGSCPGQMVLMFANPVPDGFEPQDAGGTWVGGDLSLTYDDALTDKFSLGYSFTRTTVDLGLRAAYALERIEGDRGFVKEAFPVEFVEVLKGPQGVLYGSTGVGRDSETGQRLGTWDLTTQGSYRILQPDEDGFNRSSDLTWGASGWVPERYTAASVRGTHLKATASGFNPVIADPPDLGWFKTLTNTRRDFDPDDHPEVNGDSLSRFGRMLTIDSGEIQKRTDRVSDGNAFFQVGTVMSSTEPNWYLFQDGELLITDNAFEGLRIGRATADCTVLSLRDFGTSDIGAFSLFVQESTQTPPCAGQTYGFGGLFLEFDTSSTPAVGKVSAIRGEVQLDQPSAGQVMLDLDILDRAEDGSEGPVRNEMLAGTYTCGTTGQVTITIPGGGSDPDVVLRGFSTPDAEMMYLHDFTANQQVGLAMLVRKGAGTPPLIDYSVAGLDFAFTGTPAVPRRENATGTTSSLTTRLPGALNVLGTSRTRSNFMAGVMPGQSVFQALLNSSAGGAFEYNLDPGGTNRRFLGTLSTNGRFGVAVVGNPTLTDTSIRFFFPR